ncbi:helix-turn-helix transcriptional regulator [Clostridium lacusfryxellense]|uniref:helix-turn-helix transcriptional regulator n=1 Tax=Clostridium lacusfryxellense TaxID=205328 RepID=UPI001C0E40EB|nr:helix-turn-helix transcriptional regulator [Clostridium lacusfryxellense]MBU3111957.1 helix-turn-helix transcriptional regulator [Clostridium lacusfryxellense]
MKNNIEKYLNLAKTKGKTVTEIIESSGIGRTSFYEIKSGKQVPKLDTAISIARALQTSLEEIFPQLKEELKID